MESAPALQHCPALLIPGATSIPPILSAKTDCPMRTVSSPYPTPSSLSQYGTTMTREYATSNLESKRRVMVRREDGRVEGIRSALPSPTEEEVMGESKLISEEAIQCFSEEDCERKEQDRKAKAQLVDSLVGT